MLMPRTMRNPQVCISSFLFFIFYFSFMFFSVRYITLRSKSWAFSQLFSNPAWSSSNARATQSVGGGSIQTTQSHSSRSCRIKSYIIQKKLANNESKMRGQTEREWEVITSRGQPKNLLPVLVPPQATRRAGMRPCPGHRRVVLISNPENDRWGM